MTYTMNSRVDSNFLHSIEDIDKIIEGIANSLLNVHFLQRNSLIYNHTLFFRMYFVVNSRSSA